MTRVSLIAPQFSRGIGHLEAAAALVETTALSTLYLIDHLVPDHDAHAPVLELTSVLGRLATRPGLRLGTLVLRVPMRGVEVSVSVAATAVCLAPGRLTIGLGIGDSQMVREAKRFGMPVASLATRVEEMAAAAVRIRELGAPVLMAGNHPLIRTCAADHADGWNSWGTDVLRFRGLAKSMRIANPDVEASWAGVVLLGRDRDHVSRLVEARGGIEGVVAGDPKEIAARFSQVFDAGASEIMVTLIPDQSETWDLFCEKTLPQFD